MLLLRTLSAAEGDFGGVWEYVFLELYRDSIPIFPTEKQYDHLGHP